MLGGGDSHSEHSTPATKTFSNDSLKVLVTFPTLSAKKNLKLLLKYLIQTERKISQRNSLKQQLKCR